MATRGRPRAFDRDTALQRAMDVFWVRGYEGASLAALTEAMEIRPPSLYAAFGSKEGLFREALAHYEGGDAEGEQADQQAGLGDADLEVCGKRREQADDDELGGQDGEAGGGQQEDRQ